VAYRARERSGGGPRTLAYVPRPRGKLGYLADVAVVLLAITVLVGFVRAHRLRCAWEGVRAACTWTTENALGARTEQTIAGIHGVAFRSGTTVGLVTDAANKDEDAPFGTRRVEMWDEPSALALRAFADDPGATLQLSTGPSRPLLVTAGVLGALLAYAIGTRPISFSLSVDVREGIVTLRRGGVLPRTARYELSMVRGVDVENAAPGRHRVRLVLADGAVRPLTVGFYPGERHHAFARAADAVLREARGDVTLEDA
jgi:hypothetical protein